MDPSDWRYCPRCGAGLERAEKSGAVRPVCPECGFVYFADPKVSVVVLLERAGKVLLGKRVMEPRQGFWCLPGGFVDYGEQVREAAAREVLEETGLRATIGDLLGVWDFDDTESNKKGILIVFRGEVAPGDAVASDDLEAVGWFGPGEWPPIAFPGDEALLRVWEAGGIDAYKG